MKITLRLLVLTVVVIQLYSCQSQEFTGIYDATVPTDKAKAILTPAPSEKPRINGADVFGAKPGNQCFFKIAATGKQPLDFNAEGLPEGLHLNKANGVISGKAPSEKGEYKVKVTVKNSLGKASEELLIKVGDNLALTPIMGWCSWYAFNIHVTDNDIRRMADAIERYNLVNYGWAYANIDNGWQSHTRNPETKAIQSNEKFPDMKALADYLHDKGIKFGMYNSLWISCFRGYMGATAPNEELDYSALTVPMEERETPHTLFGNNRHRFRFSGSSQVGPVWLADIDSRQYAEWGVDMMKYDYDDRKYKKDEDGEYIRAKNGQLILATPETYKDEKNLERIVREQNSFGRDMVFSSSPYHAAEFDAMMSKHANMWRITHDIKPVWEDIEKALGADLHKRISTHTKPGHYADLDMLQIGPKYESFTKGRAPLTASEQYTMVSLWAILAQPMLLSCDLDLISEFTISLMSNYEVTDINQDRLCKPAERFELDDTGKLLLYKKTLNNGQYAVGLFNVSDDIQDISFSLEQLDLDGKWKFRDVWRQKDIGTVSDAFTAAIDGHGALLLVLEEK